VIEVAVPGSKSLTNRALVCAALAEGTSTVTGALVADDTAAMTECLVALGVPIEWDGTTVSVTGVGGTIPVTSASLDARLSGTTSRFVLPLLALGRGSFRLDGSAPLRRRPMGPAIESLRALGATVDEEGEAGHLPVSVSGPVRADRVRVRADVSSQFVSGLLLAAPAMPRGLVLELVGTPVAAPFVRMTTEVMRAFNVEVAELMVPHATYRATDYAVEPDASAASYFFAASAITGDEIAVRGLAEPSLQGDLGFREVIARMGRPLHGIDVDLGDMPDTAQTFAVLAALAQGPSRVRGVSVIRGHETDRIKAVVTELRRVGVGAEETDDGFIVEPAPLRPAVVETYDDHRMAMSFALLTLVEPGIRIAEPEVVAKTFPGFWDALATVRSS
jgi:3-phosphoshikimate 1-carboxyvinyltransferase